MVDGERVFGPFRERWRGMRERARRKQVTGLQNAATATETEVEVLGELNDDYLKYSPEAEQLRIDVTLAVRNEVLKVRRACGLPDEDPKRSLAETFREEGSGKDVPKKAKKMEDGSVVQDG